MSDNRVIVHALKDHEKNYLNSLYLFCEDFCFQNRSGVKKESFRAGNNKAFKNLFMERFPQVAIKNFTQKIGNFLNMKCNYKFSSMLLHSF